MNANTVVVTYQQVHVMIAGLGCLFMLAPGQPPQYVEDLRDSLLAIYGTEDPQPDTTRFGETHTMELTDEQLATGINAAAACVAFMRQGLMSGAPYAEDAIEAMGQDLLNILVARKQAKGEVIE